MTSRCRRSTHAASGRGAADPPRDLGRRCEPARGGRAGRPGAGAARIDVPAAGSRARWSLAGAATAMVVDERGRVPDPARCARRELPARRVVRAVAAGARPACRPAWRRPADRDRAAASGGRTARSRSAWRARHRRNAHLGLDPNARLRAVHRSRLPRSSSASASRSRTQISGEPIEAEGAADPAFVQRPRGPAGGDRASPRPGDRHQPADLGRAGCACRALPSGPGACAPRCPCWRWRSPTCRPCCLLTAALQPSELAERLIAGIGPPALALVTLRDDFRIRGAGDRRRGLRARLRDRRDRRLQPHGALADRPESRGRGPLLWDRQRARGDVGRWYRSPPAPHWSPGRREPRGGRCARLRPHGPDGAVAAFAPGRFGADVGAAIGIPVGAAVAVGVCLGRRGRRAGSW